MGEFFSVRCRGGAFWIQNFALAAHGASERGPKANENAPTRVLSPGGSGSVEQSNDVTAAAVALNLNLLCQNLMQEQTAHGSDQLQVGGQGSWDDQRGGAWSRAVQGGMPKHKKR